MKKAFVFVSIIFLSTSLFSQDEDQANFQLGFHASPNIGWFNPDSDGIEGEGAKLGFSFGIIADFNITKNYSFSTGLNLLSAAGKLSFPDIKSPDNVVPASGGRTEADIRMNYVQIPLALKLKTNQIGYMRYFVKFGLGLAVNYDAEADEEFNSPNLTSSISNENVDYGDEISLIRTSLMVGLGAEYNLSGNTSLLFGLTLDNGINNILSEDIYDQDPNGNGTGTRNKDFKSINNLLVFNLGVIF